MNQPVSDFTIAGNASVPPYVGSKTRKLSDILQNNSSIVVDENGEEEGQGIYPNQFHSSFISSVDIYENTASAPIKTPGTYPAMGTTGDVSNAKLSNFYESAR